MLGVEKRFSFTIPSFTKNAVDPVGAGDAMLAYSSLSLSVSKCLVSAAIIGSIAAAIECEYQGNVPVKDTLVLNYNYPKDTIRKFNIVLCTVDRLALTEDEKYFEFKNEVSNKFWEISQKGILVKVVFGRIGIQNPQEQIKEFINEQEAKKFTDKKIREKINKGYIQH